MEQLKRRCSAWQSTGKQAESRELSVYGVEVLSEPTRPDVSADGSPPPTLQAQSLNRSGLTLSLLSLLLLQPHTQI